MSTPLLIRFVAEARELLQAAASGLLALERNPGDEAVINNVFRSVHTLKGSVGLFDFPAFTKLVHAGEDVLSAVRAGQVPLTSELVDLLLDSLDRVGAWVDEIEGRGYLPDGADGVSRDMTAALRAVLPIDFGAANAAAVKHAGGMETVAWLGDLPEAERIEAFRAALSGVEFLAVEYLPAEDCFFSGEDPVNLLRQVEPLAALAIDGREPWPGLDSLDPYRCVLRLRALTAMDRAGVETVFRYVIEQVAIATVEAHQLIVVTGDPNGGPVYGDFVDEASALLAAGDWPGLRRVVAALLELTGRDLFIASALRWMAAVLDMPEPESAWLETLIQCVATGEAVAMPPAGDGGKAVEAAPSATPSAPAAPLHEPVSLAGRLSPLAREILEGQRTILEMATADDVFASRLTAVSRTVANVLLGHARHDDIAAWTAATDAALDAGNAAPALAALSHLLEQAPPPVAADGPDATPTNATAVALPGHEQRPSANRVLKVEQSKVDALMNLIGELVVSKNSLPFLAKRAEEVHGSREMAREIKDLYGVVDRLAQEMQTAIMAVRMLPVSEVFERFPRLVRDVARKLGKRVELVMEGEDTAADKNIIEVLGDPLLHIIRNSLDHGIESPEEREATGKPPSATVRIRAFQESDQVVIEVIDDGRGIDPEKIRAAAIAKGLLDAERAAQLSDQQAVNLVFAAGFSTAAKVSDLSGRGVGMDVVVTTVEKAGGAVSLTSVKGEGTTVRLSLPLSMAVTRVMMVEAAGGMLFGIPMDHIAETVRVARHQVRRIKQAEAFVLRETIVPLLRLDRLMGMEPQVWFGDSDQEEAVLVVRVGHSLTGLVVDHFREGMDIILKPFDGILAGIPGYAGTALLGDGRVLLVLNLKELL
jgi:two-component system chemotaxis sensor kinase CheA